MLITGIAWGIAYTNSVAGTVRLTLLFVFVHFLAISLLLATGAYFLVGRLLGPGIAGLPGRRRQQGLFTQASEREQLEFGYCFDVGAHTRRKIRINADVFLNETGSDTSVLPCMDTPLRCSIHFVAFDIIKALVRLSSEHLNSPPLQPISLSS